MSIKTLLFFVITNLVSTLAKASAENEGVVTFTKDDVIASLKRMRDMDIIPGIIADELMFDMAIVFTENLIEIEEEEGFSEALPRSLSASGTSDV